MAKRNNQVVKLSNSLLDKDYSDMTVVDNRFWYGTVALVAEKQSTEVELSVDEFMDMVGVPQSKGAPYAKKLLFAMAQKIQNKTAFIEKRPDNSETLRWFFDECTINPGTRRILLKTNEKYLKAVNDFVNNFTKFSLEHYTHLPTKGAQELFVILQRNKFKGRVFVSVEELKRRLGKDSERDRNITDRVVKPAVQFFVDNNSFNEPFAIEKRFEGKRLVGYEFIFGRCLDELYGENESDDFPSYYDEEMGGYW